MKDLLVNKYTTKQVNRYTSKQENKKHILRVGHLTAYLSIFLLFLLVSVTACASAPVALKGTDLGKTPAPDFKLTDQTGQAISLADLRGKVVVLTFLYTHCPDECPLIASKLATTSGLLGDNTMKQTAFVAVSVDPTNDTPIAIAKFVQDHNLVGKLHYLTGTQVQLKPVWSAYSVYAATSVSTSSKSVSHSTRVIVIDKTGNERINFDSDLDPNDLAFDVRALLNE